MKNFKRDSLPIKHINEKVLVQKLVSNAEYPYKDHPEDVGYDITLISRTENRSEDMTGEVNNFGTGIALTPPSGYYIEMVARSSLHKHGYMLATGTSIIDPGYTGELIVPLYKYKEAEDLELPLRAVQIIVKPAVYAHLSSVKSLTPSNRGADGFGSTGGYIMPQGYPSQQGAYLQDPRQMNYMGDMNNYQQTVRSQYSQGLPRPHSATPRNNHMF